jgi:hypothetical protein
MMRNRMHKAMGCVLLVTAMLSACMSAIAEDARPTPTSRPLSFQCDKGTAADFSIGRYTDTLGKKECSTAVPIACKGKIQQAQIAPVQGQAFVYCSFPMGQANPVSYEDNQPTGYQAVTLGQTADGKFTPAIRFGIVDDDRACAQDKASYVPGMFDGMIEYYGMYARPGTTYDFKMKLDLEKGRATVWVAGRGDDDWFPLAIDATLMNPVTAINAAKIEQLPKAPGIEKLVVQSEPWVEGESIRPHPMAKRNRIVGPAKDLKFQQMKSFWRDADRHVTVARAPNAERGWWLGFPDIAQSGPKSLVAFYVDGVQHGGCGWMWAAHSNDLGKTWTEPVVLSHESTGSPRVNRLRDGSLLALQNVCEPLAPIVFFRSTDAGRTWKQIGKLDPKTAGGPEAAVPSRIVELADGAWLVAASHTPGKMGQLTGGETLEFYRSDDEGKTWLHYSTLNPPYPLSICEPSMVPLSDGRLLLFARESGGFPGVRAYSSDQGKTWSTPEELPFTVNGRTCAALLKDGRAMLTFRNHNGQPDLWAWAADPDEPSRPFVHGVHINDRHSVGLNRDGLVIDSDGVCGQFTNYRFRAPNSDDSRIDVTVEVKVIGNAGLAATLSVPFFGKLRIFPDKVRIVNDSPAEVAVAAGDFHTYRLVSEGEKLTLFVDGRQAIVRDKSERQVVASLAWSPVRQSPYALEFGNEAADSETAVFDWVPDSVREQAKQPEKAVKSPEPPTLKTITPAVTGCSVWRRFEARYDDLKTGERTIAWSAAGGEFPDQYQLDRLVEIEGTIAGWDQGYSGWVQLDDGQILIVNYTDDTARWNRTYPGGGTPWIRGTFVTPQELP